MATNQKTNGILEYKGHPLMRNNNIIYYGNMAEKYIIMMQILDSEKVQDLDVSTKISVQLQNTSPDVRSKDRIVKQTEKTGLYNALDIAEIWLNRALASK